MSAQPLAIAADKPHPGAVDGVERRACSRALEYWRSRAAPRLYPGLGAIDPDSAGDLWDSLFLVELGPGDKDHRFVSAGGNLKAALASDPTGRRVADALPAAIRDRVMQCQAIAARLKNPLDETGRWMRHDGVEIVYRSVVMPLSDDQRNITHLLGAFSFRPIRMH